VNHDWKVMSEWLETSIQSDLGKHLK